MAGKDGKMKRIISIIIHWFRRIDYIGTMQQKRDKDK